MWGFQGILLFICGLFFSLNSFAIKHSFPAMHPDANAVLYISGDSDLEDDPNPANGSTISGNGTLISDNLVITSAHAIVGSLRDLEKIDIQAGAYFRKNFPNGHSLTAYKKDYDTIKIKKVYFTNALENRIKKEKTVKESSISTEDDLVLIETDRPINKNAVPVRPTPIVTPYEYNLIKKNPDQYSFVITSVNIWETVGMDPKRYAPMAEVYIEKFLGMPFGKSILSFDSYHQPQEGDSGSPLLVAISGQWKLIAVTKGVLRDAASQKISDWLSSENLREINILPVRNIFSPVPMKICELVKKTNLVNEINKFCQNGGIL